MKPMEGCYLGDDKLGGWILEGGCQRFEEIKVRVWIELKKKKKKWEELSNYNFF